MQRNLARIVYGINNMALHIVTYEYPKRIYRGSFEISDKHYQSFLKRIH